LRIIIPVVILLLTAACAPAGEKDEASTTPEAEGMAGLESELQAANEGIRDLSERFAELNEQHEALADRLSDLEDELSRLQQENSVRERIALHRDLSNTVPVIRTCSTRLFVPSMDDLLSDSIRAGPFSIYGVDTNPSSYGHIAAANNARYPLEKAVIIVEQNVVATVVVPSELRPSLSLFYDRSNQSSETRRLISDGDVSTTFIGCSTGPTPFGGSFIVAGAQCAVVEVYVDYQRSPEQVLIPFGVDACG
jgi:hypothetical protein